MSRKAYEASTVSMADWAPLAFIVYAVLGSGAVVVSKYYEWSTWIIIGIPLAVILAYWATAWFLPRLELRRDQIGDNLYYLGFLLTLASLTVTLAQYSSANDDDYIVSNFGVALVATIAGIFGRTVVSQMRKDVVGVEREVQASLSEAALRLRGQMAAANEGYASLQRQMAQITEESVSVAAGAHSELAKGLADIIDETTKTLVEAAQRNAELLTVATAESNRKLAEVTTQQISEIHRLQGTVTARVLGAIDQLDKQVTQFTSQFEGKSQGVFTQIDEQKELMKQQSAALQRSINTFETISFDPTALRSFEDALNTSFKHLTSELHRFSEQSSTDLAALSAASNGVVAVLNDLQAQIGQTQPRDFTKATVNTDSNATYTWQQPVFASTALSRENQTSTTTTGQIEIGALKQENAPRPTEISETDKSNGSGQTDAVQPTRYEPPSFKI